MVFFFWKRLENFKKFSRMWESDFKAEVLDDICGDNVSSFELVKIDLAKSENLVHHELVKLPTVTKALLKTLALAVDKKCHSLPYWWWTARWNVLPNLVTWLGSCVNWNGFLLKILIMLKCSMMH